MPKAIPRRHSGPATDAGLAGLRRGPQGGGRLYEADNVYCFGQGNTSIIAMDAWGRFSSITSKFHWINDFHMQAITAATLGAKDVILYFSFSGAMRELSELGGLVQKTEAKLILGSPGFPIPPAPNFPTCS